MSFVERLRAELTRIERGEVELSAIGETWDEVYAGDATFRTSSGWTLVVFNDRDDYDYIDSARSPEGELWDFDSLHDVGLTRPDHDDEAAFVRRLKSAVPVEARG